MHRDDIETRLQQLRADYARRLPERLAQISVQWEALCQPASSGSVQYDGLIREFHTLAGSGASFGFPEVSRLARELEQSLKAIAPGAPPSPADKAAIDALLDTLCRGAGPVPARR
jgi:HPt (histidine-containing phosphotransfer) domain-containing protein